VTHEYTLLVGGTVLAGVEEDAPATAIAWAAGTVLALGSDDQVLGTSRGDSFMVDLRGAVVVPLGPDDTPAWPPTRRLEIGAPADLAVLDRDPRIAAAGAVRTLAVLHGGHVTRGALPGHGLTGGGRARPPG